MRAVLDVVAGLPGYSDETAPELEAILDQLVGYGDLLELPTSDGESRRLFLGPPSFVSRFSGACLILGIRPDGSPIVGEGLGVVIQYEGHTRTIHPTETLHPKQALLESGLTPMAADQWLQSPRPVAPSGLTDEYLARLQSAGPAGEIDSFQVIDPDAPVTYYRGRWRHLRPTDTGNFVGRRAQAYGAPLWCFATVNSGSVERLIDLPIQDALAPAADEAWRLQAALDAESGHPQKVLIRSPKQGSKPVIDFFSPLPRWAQRRLDIIARPLLRTRGALLSYTIPNEELEEELEFLSETMWVSVERAPEECQ
jgi:hypothetical protein